MSAKLEDRSRCSCCGGTGDYPGSFAPCLACGGSGYELEAREVAEHTPGPWRVTPGCTVSADDNAAREAAAIEEETGERRDFDVACCYVDGCISSAEAEANARLIAAAPEQHKALKLGEHSLRLAFQWMRTRGRDSGELAAIQEDLAEMRAAIAIAEAEGREVER